MPIQVNVPGLQVPAPSDPIDLATGAFVQGMCAAGGVTLNAAQLAVLPLLITAASREMIVFMGRKFGLQTYTEIVTPECMNLSLNRPAAAKLSQYPVQSVQRCATGRVPALVIENTDTTTNQDASVQLVVTGDVQWEDLTYTGLTLTRYASGTENQQTVSWTTTSPFTTIQSVADSINALSGGWKATVQTSSLSDVSIGSMPAAWMVGAREPKDAFNGGATLGVFSAVGRRYEIQPRTGILSFFGWLPGEWGGWFWFGGTGAPLYSSPDDEGCWGTGWNQVRVWYTAGFPTVPEPLQRACAEVVKLTLDRLNTDSALKTEHAGDYSYAVRDSWSSLPDWCMGTLWMYKGNFI